MAKFRFTSAMGLKLAASPDGLMVLSVAVGSDAETRGISPGDVVLGIFGSTVPTTPLLFEKLAIQHFDAGRRGLVLNVEDSSGIQRFLIVAMSEPEPEKIRGTSDDDVLDGTAYADLIMGFGGEDIVASGKRDDVLKGGSGGDRLDAGGGNDFLQGNGGNDRLLGGTGGDQLAGGSGKDKLTGGGDADSFVFKTIGDSPGSRKHRDTITDFRRDEGDTIDLKAIDARAGKKNHAFVFIGDDAFSGRKGELRYDKGKNTIVHGDVDGDGRPDFAIALSGRIDLLVFDFVL